MRKFSLVLGLGVLTILSSCRKEPLITNNGICNCGLVVSDNAYNNSVVIRNSCSGNKKRFYLETGDWMNAYVGSDYCITNISNW